MLPKKDALIFSLLLLLASSVCSGDELKNSDLFPPKINSSNFIVSEVFIYCYPRSGGPRFEITITQDENRCIASVFSNKIPYNSPCIKKVKNRINEMEACDAGKYFIPYAAR